MSLSSTDVEKVSLLARLQLSNGELDTMTRQLAKIVGYVEQLDQLDTTNVEPMAHAVQIANVFADDIVQSSLRLDDALANAPKKDEECFRVPAVLGD